MRLYSYDLTGLDPEELRKLYSQLELIIENDSPDIVFFAKKMLDNLEKTAKTTKVNLRSNPVDEIYSRNSDELISLLTSGDKIVRVNSIYALAKNGCSEKHILALERFAENAPEDEATLAIDSIEAIKVFLAEKKKREAERKKKREKALSSFQKDQSREVKAPKRIFRPQEDLPRDKKFNLWFFAFLSLCIVIIIYNIYFSFIFNPEAYLPDDCRLVEFFPDISSPVILYEQDGQYKIINLRLSPGGYVSDE